MKSGNKQETAESAASRDHCGRRRAAVGREISANLLADEELVDLIAESGGRWIFIGMESIDPANMADVNKSFSKPANYKAVLDGLARRNIYAITSFIFGMDNDTVGVADRTVDEIESWQPGLPVYGQLTPFPSTPLYKRLEAAGRLERPRHWLDFAGICHGPRSAKDDYRGSVGPRRSMPGRAATAPSGITPL